MKHTQFQAGLTGVQGSFPNQTPRSRQFSAALPELAQKFQSFVFAELRVCTAGLRAPLARERGWLEKAEDMR
ncbi:hypothetical protein TREES_T100006287 [Tupaia chinensis]|uniref:Uncharacterized protein n=1 Tax=Tupaia chinensis TaxID=246437 RepID=L9L5K0_TUPCH|nr:hypothetical protein TREES_T100006287 [Tupaia chinensis]